MYHCACTNPLGTRRFLGRSRLFRRAGTRNTGPRPTSTLPCGSFRFRASDRMAPDSAQQGCSIAPRIGDVGSSSRRTNRKRSADAPATHPRFGVVFDPRGIGGICRPHAKAFACVSVDLHQQRFNGDAHLLSFAILAATCARKKSKPLCKKPETPAAVGDDRRLANAPPISGARPFAAALRRSDGGGSVCYFRRRRFGLSQPFQAGRGARLLG
jgi:hypothetical protein